MTGPIVLFVSLYALLLCSVADGFSPALTFQKSNLPSSLSASVLTNDGASKVSFDILPGKHVLVVGGSGRVGGSVVTQLVKRGCKVTVGRHQRRELSSGPEPMAKTLSRARCCFEKRR